jgi:hypothetical protein
MSCSETEVDNEHQICGWVDQGTKIFCKKGSEDIGLQQHWLLTQERHDANESIQIRLETA